MKVALIRYHDRAMVNTREIPSVVNRMGAWPPLGIAYLSASLRQAGHCVSFFDCVREGWTAADLERELRGYGPDMAGITTTTPEIQGAVEAATVARATARHVIVGGPHLSLLPVETMAHPCFDYAVAGEGEEALPKLIEVLGGKGNIEEVPGLVWRAEGKVVRNPHAIVPDLDALPFPDRGVIPPRRYERADARRPMATMISTRGCPFTCGFCHRPPEQRKVRHRSPGLVADEMDRLVKEFGVREIIFCNDMLTVNAAQIEALCREIRRRRLRVHWQGATRVDIVDAALMRLMRESGCTQLKFGVESGSQAILDRMRKGITIKQVRTAFAGAREAGLKTGAYFILGYVGETPETLEATIRLACELRPDYVMFYPGVPLPGTLFHDDAVSAGLIDPDYWKGYTLGTRSDRLPFLVPDLDGWLQKAFGSFYRRPAYLFQRIRDPRAWRALLHRPRLISNLFQPRMSIE